MMRFSTDHVFPCPGGPIIIAFLCFQRNSIQRRMFPGSFGPSPGRSGSGRTGRYLWANSTGSPGRPSARSQTVRIILSISSGSRMGMLIP